MADKSATLTFEEALQMLDEALEKNQDNFLSSLKEGYPYLFGVLSGAAQALRPPPTEERVPMHTAPEVQQQIRHKTVINIGAYLNAPEHQLTERINELDQEWDIERVLEANAASLALMGIVLSRTASRTWILLPTAVAAFLLQHAVQGWCPPVPVLRRIGVRTAGEIHAEKIALKRVRGDFGRFRPRSQDPEKAAVQLWEECYK